jgi:large subunit ribosomal protein L7/L12
MSDKFKDIIEKIEGLSVLELSELVKTLEEKFGVSAAVTFAVGAPTSQGASVGAEEAEEKSTFNVELKSVGEKKIEAIKILRDTLGLGLKEAKDMADKAPSIVKEGMDQKSAEELKAKLEAAGCKVELK